MDQKIVEQLHKIVTSAEWVLVNTVLDGHAQRLSSIDELDMTMEPTVLKNHLEARRLAKEIIDNVLMELRGYGVQKKPVNPITRSMR